MKNIITKSFESEKWFTCLNEAERFLLEYGLDLVSLKMIKENDRYVVNIEYGLGVGR